MTQGFLYRDAKGGCLNEHTGHAGSMNEERSLGAKARIMELWELPSRSSVPHGTEPVQEKCVYLEQESKIE